MDKTPIQELIHWLEEWNYNEAAYHAKKVFLSKEREFVGKTWDAAIKHEEVKVAGERGLLSIVNHNPAPDKQQFINQLYPEK